MNINNNLINNRSEVIKSIKNNKSFAIAIHNGPDGDCIGSAVALEKTLLKLNKNVDIIIHNKVSPRYTSIIGEKRVNRIFVPPIGKVYDVVFLLDCSDFNRTYSDVRSISNKIIVIDHHYGAAPIGDIYLYEKASSTGIIIYNLIKNLVPITNEIATALYLTIRSDTGNFKNSNTDVKSHEIAADLLLKGASISEINEIYDNKTLSMIKLMGYTFSNLCYDSKYKLVYLVITLEHIRKANSNYEEASSLLDYIKGINNSDITFLFVEGYESVRIKARSKNINVANIMERFNGGGHPTAAGALIYDDDIYGVVDSLISYTRVYIDKTVRSDING